MSDEEGKDTEGVDKEALAEERTEWAEERTEWADQRTYLAQQRTFAGWLRTALTSMAVGFGILEFIRELSPQWLLSAIGFIFIAVGGLILVVAYMSYRKVSLHMKESKRPEMEIPILWIGIITFGLLACALGGLVFVFT